MLNKTGFRPIVKPGEVALDWQRGPMKEISWDASYEIGVEEIDRQHADFIRLLRRVGIALQRPIPLAIQLQLLQELVKYADYHFCSEENVMLLTKCPDLIRQKSEHSQLLILLDRKVNGYRIAPHHGEELLEFLYDWFVNHTQVEDRKIAVHLGNEQKPKAVGQDGV